uniref:DNA polymerase n=1 Tax=Acrobeloides nanus TaxID=290746 RepID=A0A914C0B3_9BILA
MSDDDSNQLEPSIRRSSRSRKGASTSSKVQDALQKLKNARHHGTIYRENVENLVSNVYDEVTEEEYEKIVRERREAADFVVDDDGAGYIDDGEDFLDEYEDEHQEKRKKKDKEKKGNSSKTVKDDVNIKLEEDEALAEILQNIGQDNDLDDFGIDNEPLLPPASVRNPFKRTTSPDILAPRPIKVSKLQQPIKSSIHNSTSSSKYHEKNSVAYKKPEAILHQTSSNAKLQNLKTEDDFDSPEVYDDFEPPLSPRKPAEQDVANLHCEPKLQVDPINLDSQKLKVEHRLFVNRIKEDATATLENFDSQWFENESGDQTETEVSIGEEAFSEIRDGKKVIKMYWLDAFEDNLKHPGMVYLFDVPKEADTLEVQYEGNLTCLPANFSGDTFTHVFNTTSTALERILVERDLKGPCWIEIVDAVTANPQISFCDFEYTVDMTRMKGISMLNKSQVDPIPSISLLALNIISVVNEKSRENEVVMISLIYDAKSSLEKPNTDIKRLTSKTILCKGNLPINLKKEQMEHIIKVTNERQLLSRLLVEVRNFNPDILLAHDTSALLTTLVTRMEKHKLKDWSKLGRLKRTTDLSELGKSKFSQWKLTAGRLVLDSKSSAMELVRSRSYDLEELVAKVLLPVDPNAKRLSLSAVQIAKSFNSVNIRGDIELMQLINWSRMEAYLPLRIVAQLNALPLFAQITQIVGGVLSRTLMGGRAERNEYLLLHAFYKNGYVAPDKHLHDKKSKIVENEKEDEETKATSKKAQYTGGLVLEPKKGLYETYIILLDFNSLYPSIIQEYNVCFTTIEQNMDMDEADLPKFPDASTPEGILPREIRTLVQRRREVKKLMKECKPNSEQYIQYDIRQIGLKLTANSMYGCLGFSASRFYAKALAAMITSKGREILTHTKELVEKNGFSVVYGDTDSIMVDTCSTDLVHAKKVGHEIKKMVNQCYRLLELDIDGIFKRLLLLKKKKYAALVINLQNEKETTQEMKGLDIVRRDWSELAKDIGERVVNLILSSLGRDELLEEIHRELTLLKEELQEGKVTIEKFEILKQLTRNPQDYKDIKAQPHVTVALRLNESQKFKFKKDDVVKYIICEDGTNSPATQRAYHRSEIETNDKLTIDIHYYLAHQVHPVVSRLCEPIEEMDAVRVAQALGLDPSGYRKRLVERAVDEQVEEENIEAYLKQDFNACEGFCFECPVASCKQLIIVRSAFMGDKLETKFSLEACPKCNSDIFDHEAYLQNCLDDSLRGHIKQYLQSPYTCDDITCQYSREFPSRNWTPFGCICNKCNNGIMRKEYSGRKLFDQQCFFKKIFDLEEAMKKECTHEIETYLKSRSNYAKMKTIYDEFKRVVETYLEHNDYNRVDLSFIFAPMIRN